MKLDAYEAVAKAFDKARVRYLVVGGLAVVDVFVHEPFDFAAEYERAVSAELLPGIFTRYVSIPTLIRMKMVAGRPRDLDDIRHLKRLQENRHGD